jgi:hypothetical protein
MSRAPTRALRGSGRRCGGEFRWISDGGRPSRRGFEEIRSAFQALIALDLALDLKLRKNEAKRLGFGREVDGGSKLRPSCSASWRSKRASFSALATAALRSVWRAGSSAMFFSTERRMRRILRLLAI